ncbi:MAG: sulfatase-like hydrolase/transferase [Phycisphaera sp.]|nr:sulfatase-like hydrolase/transferase [Phycisphaera sp.]
MNHLARCALALVLTLAAFVPAAATLAADKPNFVFILSEDNSQDYLRMYDPTGAPTPNIEKLAEHGLIFDHAFSNAPVCSVARTTLATSVYAPRIGTQFHRKIQRVTLPEGWKLFQEYLQDAGYFTTNNSKTDYNVDRSIKVAWDDSSKKASWRERKDKSQPFFHMETHTESHESCLHFTEQQWHSDHLKTDINSVKVWPYHPDTDLFRYTVARYHDKIMVIDDIVGDTVGKLRADGLLDDTFIFYFGDHGGVLPGSKGYAYNRGLQTALVVYVPKNFQNLLDPAMKPGTRVGGFVEFVDFGPTLLHLAGVDVPQHMSGTPFLGKDISLADLNKRDETFGYADRMDERYEFVRTLRKGDLKYMRFFQGYYPDGLQNNYRYKQLGYVQWREMFKAGKLNAEQSEFFESKPAEALYDIATDPWELHNLAGDPKYGEQLKMMRDRLTDKLSSIHDLSLYPESYLIDEAVANPQSFAEAHAKEIDRLIGVANLALLPFEEAKPRLIEAMHSDNRWDRYWAATDCAVLGETARPLVDEAKKLLDDSEPLVRVRAAEFLGRIHAADPVPTLMDVLKNSHSPAESLITLNGVVYLRDDCGYKFHITKKDVKAAGGEVDRRLEYLAE